VSEPEPIHILYMEDDPGLGRLFQKKLERAGYLVDVASDGEEGLRMYAAGQYDVLAIDQTMPALAGLDVIRALASQGPLPPIIMVTGSGNEETAVAAMKLGASDYVVKGVDLGYLDLLPTVIEKARQQQQLVEERKQALEALRASEARYRGLFEGMPVGLYRSTPQGKLLDVNPALVRMLGYPDRETLVNTDASDLYADADDRVRCSALVEREGSAQGFEVRFRRYDGEIIWGLDTVRIVCDAEGQVLHYEGSLQDISEQKQSHEEREKLIKELDDFGHTVAHDLKNPLGTILGFAQVLTEYGDTLPSETLQDSLRSISLTAQNMNNIIEELMLLAGVRKGEVVISTLDMESIVSEVRLRLTNLIDQYRPEIILPDAWPTARGYAPWVGEVWANYISNALTYGGEPPRVQLGATTLPGETVRFWVRDNGAGLTPEQLASLFTPFSKLAQVRAKGHGLGLSIVQRLVERLNGQVGVDSEVGKGSTFWFTLPA